ncbi:MAG: DUF3656 domain-containing U32 family peptidase [Patescibacteria group bacterium]
MLELVAPAGDMDALCLAVAHGADAVYLGGRSFSARQYAANFDRAGLAAAIRLAHLHGVKVYVAMNTLLREDEMEEALSQAREACLAGADALIVQDLGFLAELRRLLPGLRLHASTQMTVANAATVEALSRLGISRVILPREASEAEVRALSGQGVETEVFVHGALCYSYSGQCLMSSLIGGRSGNRGRCAQPCRLEYDLVGPDGDDPAAGEGRYLLSPRDLRLLPHLPRLMAAGVAALKIEGRMKRPEYVGTVVRVYRRALDRLAGRPEGFAAFPDEERDLLQIFNRGFTTGFFAGERGTSFLSRRRPNNRGLPVGRVTAVDRKGGTMDLALTEALHRGDGLEIWVTRGGRAAFTVDGMLLDGREVQAAAAGDTVAVPLLEAARTGDRVFRTHDAELNARALAPLADGSLDLPFWARARVRIGEPLVLELSDGEGAEAVVRSDSPGQAARTAPLTVEAITAQLSRTGGSGWRPAGIEVDLEPGVMAPLSVLNRLRRAGLDALAAARLAKLFPRAAACGGAGEADPSSTGIPIAAHDFMKKTTRSPAQREGRPYRPVLCATAGAPDEAYAALAEGIGRLYLASWTHPWPDADLAALAAEAAGRGTALVYALPRVAPEREAAFWRTEMERAAALGLDGLRLGDLGLASTALPAWRGRIFLDFSLNIMNPWTLRLLLGYGERAAFSPELTLAQVKVLAAAAPGRGEILVHGRLEMMLSAHCLIGALPGEGRGPDGACGRPCEKKGYALRDRLGMLFPLEPDRFCRMHVMNSVDLSLLPELDRVAELPCDIRLELHGRGPGYAAAVVRAYRRGLEALAGGGWTKKMGEEAEEELASFSPAGFTRGHYFRGVE